MGRPPNKSSGIVDHPSLWPEDELPRSHEKLPELNFRSVRYPLWTKNKAKLIEEYLRLFEFITHHGTYIDGFAAPQDFHFPDTWAAKLVLEMEPKWFREFWLCDLSVDALNALKAEHESEKRKVEVLKGDFNKTVYQILDSGRIKESIATFALLDQRTFECEWRTIVALSRHKTTNKIELFYFFPSGWIDRSIGAVKAPETVRKVDRWWGKDNWRELCGMNGIIRAKLVAQRFESELGYKRATVYPIHSERRGGRVMYHMIHATDHAAAPQLMVRAYRKVSGRTDIEPEIQLDLDDLLRRFQEDED